ncbi:MAG: hypothetical protein AB7S65_07085 [Sulfuricurvum sp.]
MKSLFISLLSLGIVASVSSADALNEGKNALEHHDYVRAVEQFTLACNQNNASGCFDLAALNQEGTGTAQNKYAASALYARACTLGNQQGCANMGLGYDNP